MVEEVPFCVDGRIVGEVTPSATLSEELTGPISMVPVVNMKSTSTIGILVWDKLPSITISSSPAGTPIGNQLSLSLHLP